MKTTCYKLLILVCALMLLTGCLSTQNIKKTFSPDQAENELYAQVPERYQKPVQEARANQLGAAESLKFADESLTLAKLKKELATKQQKLAEYQLKLAEMAHKESILGVELTQWEAIDKAGLGDKEKNIKTIYDLRTKKAKIETSRLAVKKDHDTLQLHIQQLAEQIKVQEETVATMKAVLEGSDVEQIPAGAPAETPVKEAPADAASGQQQP